MFISVDLPDPDEPMMATNSPCPTVRLTPRSAWTVTSPRMNVRVTFSILRSVPAIAGLCTASKRGLRSAAAANPTRSRSGRELGDDDRVARVEVALDDFGETAVVEAQRDVDRDGRALAQHPDARAVRASRPAGPAAVRSPR